MAKHLVIKDTADFNLFRVAVSERQLRTALGYAKIESRCVDALVEVFAKAGSSEVSKMAIMGPIRELIALRDAVVTRLGRVRVRYLQDLKPSDYGTDVHFFHLHQQTTPEDFGRLLMDALSSPGEDGASRMVNVALVRDIEVKLNSNTVLDVHRDYAVVHTFVQAVMHGEWVMLEDRE